jgi:hypothetical protein
LLVPKAKADYERKKAAAKEKEIEKVEGEQRYVRKYFFLIVHLFHATVIACEGQ